jgi:uncharacterized protein (TIGR03435 family)
MRVVAFAVLMTLVRIQAQSFDVASIKPPNPRRDRGTNMSTDGGTLRMHNATLKFCIMAAYGVQENQIEGGPGWINSDQYEITAKAAGLVAPGELLPMLRTLLEARFKLSLHRETKQLPVCLLTVAKSGSKLHPAEASGEGFLGRRGRGPLTGRKASIPELASTLSMLMGRKVLDQTGLTELYDFTLEYAPADAPDSDLPSLVTALQEQLGLKLEAGKGPVEVVVIDHAEKPTVD